SSKLLTPDLYIKVGHWCPLENYNLMKATGRVVEEQGGKTYFSIMGPEGWPAAPKGWVYSEFEIRANSLYEAGREDWWQAVHPTASKAFQQQVLRQGGELAPPIRNLSEILEVKK